MRNLVLVALVVNVWTCVAQDKADSTPPQLVGVREMSGAVWVCWASDELPWESGDVIPRWMFIRTSRNLHSSDLCDDTLRLTLTDTLLLDMVDENSYSVMQSSGFFGSLGEEGLRLWGRSPCVPYPLEGKPTPSVDCGSTKYWNAKFEKKMVLLFRVPSAIYACRLRIATVDKEIMIGLVTDEESAFAQLVRRKFPGRID